MTVFEESGNLFEEDLLVLDVTKEIARLCCSKYNLQCLANWSGVI